MVSKLDREPAETDSLAGNKGEAWNGKESGRTYWLDQGH